MSIRAIKIPHDVLEMAELWSSDTTLPGWAASNICAVYVGPNGLITRGWRKIREYGEARNWWDGGVKGTAEITYELPQARVPAQPYADYKPRKPKEVNGKLYVTTPGHPGQSIYCSASFGLTILDYRLARLLDGLTTYCLDKKNPKISPIGGIDEFGNLVAVVAALECDPDEVQLTEHIPTGAFYYDTGAAK